MQASAGKCNEPKPGAFDFVGKAKWTAWNDLGDLSKVGIWKKANDSDNFNSSSLKNGRHLAGDSGKLLSLFFWNIYI